MDYYQEFKSYAIKHMGISGTQFHSWERIQDQVYGNSSVSASMTPFILEEREMRVTQMDIFSRLMQDRILWLAGPVNDRMSTVVQAQLMFLDNVDSTEDIRLFIDSPGGSVKSGLSIVDMMNWVTPDIQTVCTGMAASMGSILLGAGSKGKRSILPNSKVMLHQVSYGFQGHFEDAEISRAEALKYNTKLMKMLADYSGQDIEKLKQNVNRDFWLEGQEAVDYGIVDKVQIKKGE
jgi:ATP-dependent Clp protease, protease subunit